MTDFYAMEREEEVFEEMTGWRSFWLVRWGRTKVVNPLMVILRRYVFCNRVYVMFCL